MSPKISKELFLPSILLKKMSFYVINITSKIIFKRIKGDNDKETKHIYR